MPLNSQNPSINLLRGVAIGLPVYFVAANLWAVLLIGPQFLHHADLRQLYAGAYIMRTGNAHSLYDFALQKKTEDIVVSAEPDEYELPFVSPAYYAFWLAPLSKLPYKTAYFALVALDLALLASCAWLLKPWTVNLRAIYPWLPLAMLAGFPPVGTTFIMGQNSVWLTFLLIAAFVLLDRDRNVAAGSLVALSLFKFQIAIPIAIVFLLCRRWRFSLGVSAAVLAIFSVWLTGIQQAKHYVLSILALSTVLSRTGIAQPVVLWNVMANVTAVLIKIFRTPTATFWVLTASLGASVGLFVFSVRRGYRKSDADLLLMAIPCAVLVSYHTYPHDLSVLLLPMLVLLDSVILKMPPRKLLFNPAALMFVSAAVVYFLPNEIFWLASFVFLLLLQASKSRMPLTLAPEVRRGDAADLDRRNLAESTAAGWRSPSGV
jgi:hypothetical protein